ncbi:unnamed protein product [Cylicocyclus nassatus]|uniref:Major sperm protein n=1 Tax=Cylicocyclus nassatus TaxID=53992 RepID=A0AA36M844_CYLNA|nr:unnamed protein product [Cylicocyclus nassatus]
MAQASNTAGGAPAASNSDAPASENRSIINTQRMVFGMGKEEIEYTPEQMDWTMEEGKQTLWVMNRTLSQIAFKVKCSNNKAFWVNPVFGTVESGGAAEIEVHRNGNKPLKNNDKIVVCTAKYNTENGPLNRFFKLPTTTTEEKEIRQRTVALPSQDQQRATAPAPVDNQMELMRC